MALERGSIGKDRPLITPLESGFKDYTPVGEIPGFQLKPEIQKALAQRLEQLAEYHKRPAGIDIQPV